MLEKQNIEWKESWRDEYLEYISAFSNAEGGKIYIGINDKGVVVGISDYENLLVNLPNKIKDLVKLKVFKKIGLGKKTRYELF